MHCINKGKKKKAKLQIISSIFRSRGNSKDQNLSHYNINPSQIPRMSLQVINCSICDVYQPCYNVCCSVVFVCHHCLMDSEILANHNECLECYRPLEVVYNNLVNKIRFNEGSRQRTFPNSKVMTPQSNLNHSQIRNKFNFQETTQQVEEEFEFADVLQQRQTKARKFANNFTSRVRSNSNMYQQQNYNHQGINNSFGQNIPPQQKNNPGNIPFSQRNNFGNGQFNGKSHCNQSPHNPNLGFRHQNDVYENENYVQGNGYMNGNGNGGFNQNIRQSQNFNRNNGFQQNMFQNNNFTDNNQYQNQQKMGFGADNNQTNTYPMWNQQRPNNVQSNNFNHQKQGNFNQNHSQGKNSFQSNNNSFRNTHSYERETKSVGKVHQLKRVNNFNGNSSSFKVDNNGNHSNSDKEHSPSFGTEFNNEQCFSGAIIPFGSKVNVGRERMEIEQEETQQTREIKKTKSYDSLVTLGGKGN